jgi:hypothetical protein
LQPDTQALFKQGRPMQYEGEYIFSREAVSRMSGETEYDQEYLHWFCTQCLIRINSAVQDINNVYDGQSQIDDKLPAFLSGRFACIKFHFDQLKSCTEQFRQHHDFQTLFRNTINDCMKNISQARENANYLLSLFK